MKVNELSTRVIHAGSKPVLSVPDFQPFDICDQNAHIGADGIVLPIFSWFLFRVFLPTIGLIMTRFSTIIAVAIELLLPFVFAITLIVPRLIL